MSGFRLWCSVCVCVLFCSFVGVLVCVVFVFV